MQNDIVNKTLYRSLMAVPFLLIAGPAAAQEVSELNSGDTSWLLTSTALVLFMTLPGLSLFYGGLVRTKNVLSVLMQCFAIASVVTILWVFVGYSLCFNEGNTFVGDFGKAFFKGVTVDSLSGTIPESVFSMFQLTFAIITPALIVGAFAERMKFSAMLLFSAIWVVIVYCPVCHWVWGGGWLSRMGFMDFAGGAVVHINAGFAGLVAAIMLGKRTGYPNAPMPPHNMTMAVTGAGMLWVGWFGFNAGSQLAADGGAGMAMTVTQLSAATAATTWMFIEWFKSGKPSALGIITGAIGGLAAVTPASGFIGPCGGFCIGLVSGVICYWGATTLKEKCGYDDSLDAFGVHGIGGVVGTMMAGLFASGRFQGGGVSVESGSVSDQLLVQAIGCAATIAYTCVLTFVILAVIKAVMGIRVSEEIETEGLDVHLHSEPGYNL